MEYNRRAFIKTGILVAASLCFSQRGLSAITRTDSSIKTLRFYNMHTEERIKADYFYKGAYQPEELEKINHLLRDHRTGEIHPIDTQLLDLLFDLQSRLNIRKPFHVISGFRSQTTNTMLAGKTCGVAKKSLHTRGKAIDIRVPGLSTRSLRNRCINLQGGGVGYYPKAGFVHVDTGPIRCW